MQIETKDHKTTSFIKWDKNIKFSSNQKDERE